VADRLSVSIIGASGYTGGELLRLALAHPHLEVKQVTSERLDGQFVHFTHANLRKRTQLKFVRSDAVEKCDLLFLGLPHGSAMSRIDQLATLADRIVDLSADFRLRDAPGYDTWYGKPHTNPRGCRKFVYGLPELHRAELKSRSTSAASAATPPRRRSRSGRSRRGLIDTSRGVICEVKVGSSEGGAASADSTHHPERAGVMRSFAPTGHRHTAEVLQALKLKNVVDRRAPERDRVDNVRGVLATAHVFVKPVPLRKTSGKRFREAYNNKPSCES
jgi:N-acetyl-gamma-glutamyl-phosphate/LysW-gamma-L-alpha-aminoadipyl-6-phosphate reductase